MGLDWSDRIKESNAPLVRASKPMNFVSLHHHSTFSFLDGHGLPEAHVRRAAELGMTDIALTEHGNVSSHPQLEMAGEKYDIGTIFGCELYTGQIDEERRSRRKNHLTVLASSQEGYKNVLRMVSRGFAEGFYSEPTVDGEIFADHMDGVIALSGCQSSLLATSMIGGKNIDPADASFARAKRVAEKMRDAMGDRYYLEVQAFPELDKTVQINTGIARISAETGIPMVATLDAHYTKPEDGEIQAILHNLRPGKRQTIEEQMRNWGYDVPLAPLGDKEILRRLKATGLSHQQATAAIMNTREIADRCRGVFIPKVDNLAYPLPTGADDARSLFRSQIAEGWKYRGFDKLPPKERDAYIERVKYEMKLMEEKDFVDYFLVVGDLIRWAKDVRTPEIPLGIGVGPARGSSAASLVCYLLRIIEVNPMKFSNLLFERFIDANRMDLPDIDIDFDDRYDDHIFRYLQSRYGDDHVGRIATFVRFKGKNSLDDVARVFDIPSDQVEVVKNLLLERVHADLRASATIVDTVDMFTAAEEVVKKYPDLMKATLLEGNFRGMSVHAAGIVVANTPLTDFCAIYTKVDRENGGRSEVISIDRLDAEHLNALKIDALGLATMGVCEIALRYAGLEFRDLYDIDYNDPDILAAFKREDLTGIFQFEGRAMRQVNKMVSPDSFGEICDINALVRPGPLHSGATSIYADVKHGRVKPEHFHPIVDEITEPTQFQIVYQEQMLRIVRQLAGFSWEESAKIRKMISKKHGEAAFNKMRDRFVSGAKKQGVDSEAANKIFDQLATAGAYAFNASHCVSYGMLAYWTQFLKQNYPAEFFAASLSQSDKGNKASRDKVKSLLLDMDQFGRSVKLAPLSLNEAEETWSLKDGAVTPGLRQVKGIGNKSAPSIIELRNEHGGFESWSDLSMVPGIGPKTIETIEDFVSDPDPFGLLKLTREIYAWRDQLEDGISVEDGPFFERLPTPSHTAADVPYEKTPTNIPVTFLAVVRERNLKDLFEVHFSRTGQVLAESAVNSPHKAEWVVMDCEDHTDRCIVTASRFKYAGLKEDIWGITLEKDVILCRGVKLASQARRAIYVDKIWNLTLLDKEGKLNYDED